MIVVDTNVISELMRPQSNIEVYQWVASQPISNLFTTTITQAEILYGIALLPSGKRQKALSQADQLMFQRREAIAKTSKIMRLLHSTAFRSQ